MAPIGLSRGSGTSSGSPRKGEVAPARVIGGNRATLHCGGTRARGDQYPCPMSDEARSLTDVVTRLRRALRTSIRSEWPWDSLPMARVELLQTLAERPPMRVGDLAAELRLAPNTVSGLVGQLIDGGLVARAGDPTDRRVALLSVTPLGHEKLAVWQSAHEKRLGAALDRLEPAERADIVRALAALDRLVDHLRAS